MWIAREGLLRPGEVARLQKRTVRRCSDMVSGLGGSAVATIEKPKTRKVFARVQHAMLEDEVLVELLMRWLETLEEEERIWPFSLSTLGRRLKTLLMMVCPQTMTRARVEALWTFACIRAGKATALWMRERNLPKLRLQGRWKREATLEHYVQEAVARLACHRLPKPERESLEVLKRGAVRWATEWVEAQERQWRWRMHVMQGRRPPARAEQEGDAAEEAKEDDSDEDSLEDDGEEW